MSEELKTIKELADELGVTKQNIQYYYQRLPKELQIKSSNGSNIINSKAKSIIVGKVEKNSKSITTKGQQTDSKIVEKSDKEEEQLVAMLIEEIKYLKSDKDKILTTKDQQIEKLTNLLDQQQRLALQDKKLLEEYKAENDSLKALKMPSQDIKQEQPTNPDEEGQNVVDEPRQALKKWYQFWK